MRDTTKSNIAQALIFLLQKRSLKEITIQDIVDKAGYSRKNFLLLLYEYFRSCGMGTAAADRTISFLEGR